MLKDCYLKSACRGLYPTSRANAGPSYMQAVLAGTHRENMQPAIVDLDHSKGLTKEIRKELLTRAVESQDMENEQFLKKVKDRLDR